MYEKLKILSSEQVEQIHTHTLRIFEEVGLKVGYIKGREMWLDLGAHIDQKNGRILIPAHLAEEALKTVPEKIICGARNETYNLVIGDGKIYNRNGGGPGQVTDLETGQLRNASLSDTADYARLVNGLGNLHIAAPVYEQDSIPEMRDIQTLACMFRNTCKHINIRLLNPANLPYLIRMAEIVAGDRQALKQKPPITLLESPISPLIHPDVLIDSILACGEYGIPLEICSMPIAGATGPITLAGSLLMSNVEMLGAVVFGQLAYPGMPMIFAPRIMVMDMSNGFALTGSMENALLASAGAQLAKEAYGVPVNVHGPYTDSPLNDCQAGIENTYFSLMSAMAGADVLTGAGHLQGGLVVNFAQLVMDDELAGLVCRAVQGMTVDEEHLGYEALKASIETDNLLMHPHTLRNLRSDRYRAKLMMRTARATWEAEGSKSMHDRAVEKVESLLANHEPLPLEEFIQKGIGDLITEARHKLSEMK